jgi:hypothetical protein
MLKRLTVAALLALTLALAGCAEGDKEDEAAAPGATPVAPPSIVYDQGIFDLERSAETSWRWTEPAAVVRLRNTGRDMTLKIAGRWPLDRFPKPPVMKITFNGETLDTVTATPEGINKEYAIPAAKQGSGQWSDLKLENDRFFVPKEIDKNSSDTRRLVFALNSISWEAK